MANRTDKYVYAGIIEDIAFDLKNGEDKRTIASSLRMIADELDPPRRNKK